MATSRELGSLQVLAGDARFSVCLGGVGPRSAAQAARRLIDAGCNELVSWGLAGALCPALGAGALIRPSLVVDAESRTRYPATGGDPGSVMISLARVATWDDKRRLTAAHGTAAAVDLESAAIARECLSHGVAFRVCRAISDALDDAWIDVVAELVDGRGRLRPWPIAKAAACRPGALLAAWRGSACAVATLAGQARALVGQMDRKFAGP